MPDEAEGFFSLELYLFHAWAALAVTETRVNLCVQKKGLVDTKLGFICWNSFWLLFLFLSRKPCQWQVGVKIVVFLITVSLIYSLIWKIERDTYSLALKKTFFGRNLGFFLLLLFLYPEIMLCLIPISQSKMKPWDEYIGPWKAIPVNKLIQLRPASSTFCSFFCAAYWLIYLREEIPLTQILSKFLRKISALKREQKKEQQLQKLLIFHLQEPLNIWIVWSSFNPLSAERISTKGQPMLIQCH